MNEHLPHEIEVVTLPDGVRYVLRHPPGTPRFVAFILSTVSLIPMGMGIGFIVFALEVLTAPFPFNWLIIPLWVFPACFVLGGLGLLLFSLFLLIGRTEIVITPDTLSASMCVGPFRWRGTRRRYQVLRLQLEIPRAIEDAAVPPNTTLAVEDTEARRMILLLAHSRSTMTALANDLAQRWGEMANQPPLPILEVDTGSTSRAWRQSRPSASSSTGQIPTSFGVVFFSFFLIIGGVFFYLILTTLIDGDKNNNLQGAFPYKYLWALFPLPFILVGVGGLIYQIRARSRVGLSPEQQASLPSSTPVEQEHPTIPTVQTTPGLELAHKLEWSESPGCNLVGFIVLLGICSGILTPIFHKAVNLPAGFRNAGDFFGTFFPWGLITLFLLLAWFGLVYGIIRYLRLWRMGQPRVELSAHPVHPGQSCELLFALPSTMRLATLQILLICEEEAKYRQGTDTRTETRCVHRAELAADSSMQDEVITSSIRKRLFIPTGAMHSFESANNKIRWVLRLEGKGLGILPIRFQHDFPLIVQPQAK